MILDDRLEFADATALSTGGTGRALVGDVVDLNPTTIAPNVLTDASAAGRGLFLVLQVDTAVTSAGSATVTFELVSDAQAAIATDGSATLHAATAAIPKATLVAGYQLVIPLPPGRNYERYLGVIANVGTAALTAGKVNAFLTHDPSVIASFADYVG